MWVRRAARRLVRSLFPVSRARRESNRWLRIQARDVTGRVLSIGSGDDRDGEGDSYRRYFSAAASYTTSEVTPQPGIDLALDVRRMPEIGDASFDCVFCSGVLEHVDDISAALAELTRILKPGGLLLLGLPFRQALHHLPHDYWRFTEFGVRRLLADQYDLLELVAVDARPHNFPAGYWAGARRKLR